jgi:hypothetical protein
MHSPEDPGHGWPNRPTWALACWLHGRKYCYLRDTAIATWLAHKNTFNPSGKALAAMTEKLNRDVTVNAAAIQPERLDRPLVEVLEEIDWGAIADHWLVLGNGYRRRAKPTTKKG